MNNILHIHVKQTTIKTALDESTKFWAQASGIPAGMSAEDLDLASMLRSTSIGSE